MLIVVSGKPASGKTTLAYKLGKKIGVKVLSRDSIKEFIFDALGYSDREWSNKVGALSFDILYKICLFYLKEKGSLIVETNFKAAFDFKKISEVAGLAGAQVVEVYCDVNLNTLKERFKKRAISSRHLGHRDSELSEKELELLFSLKKENLGFANYLEISTQNFKDNDLSILIKKIKAFKN